MNRVKSFESVTPDTKSTRRTKLATAIGTSLVAVSMIHPANSAASFDPGFKQNPCATEYGFDHVIDVAKCKQQLGDLSITLTYDKNTMSPDLINVYSRGLEQGYDLMTNHRGEAHVTAVPLPDDLAAQYEAANCADLDFDKSITVEAVRKDQQVSAGDIVIGIYDKENCETRILANNTAVKTSGISYLDDFGARITELSNVPSDLSNMPAVKYEIGVGLHELGHTVFQQVHSAAFPNSVIDSNNSTVRIESNNVAPYDYGDNTTIMGNKLYPQLGSPTNLLRPHELQTIDHLFGKNSARQVSMLAKKGGSAEIDMQHPEKSIQMVANIPVVYTYDNGSHRTDTFHKIAVETAIEENTNLPCAEVYLLDSTTDDMYNESMPNVMLARIPLRMLEATQKPWTITLDSQTLPINVSYKDGKVIASRTDAEPVAEAAFRTR